MTMPPSTIFRYQEFTLRSLQSLELQTIYFGSPKNFNDPYDCASSIIIEDSSLDEKIKAAKLYLPEIGFSEKDLEKLFSLPDERLNEILSESVQNGVEYIRNNILSERGITCFSECNEDLLMWSHYGGQYSGFCMEFDTRYAPFDTVKRVRYEKDMPRATVDDLFFKERQAQVFEDLVCTKSSSWAYEKEWRALHEIAGTVIPYKPEALKSIYFGPNIAPVNIGIILSILKERNPSVVFYYGNLNKVKFRVEFMPFEPTSMS